MELFLQKKLDGIIKRKPLSLSLKKKEGSHCTYALATDGRRHKMMECLPETETSGRSDFWVARKKNWASVVLRYIMMADGLDPRD